MLAMPAARGDNAFMTAIKLSDIQRDLLGHLQRVAKGESLLIVQGDEPLAELRPPAPQPRQLRPFGLCAGEFTVPEDFDQPLPEALLREFEGR